MFAVAKPAPARHAFDAARSPGAAVPLLLMGSGVPVLPGSAVPAFNTAGLVQQRAPGRDPSLLAPNPATLVQQHLPCRDPRLAAGPPGTLPLGASAGAAGAAAPVVQQHRPSRDPRLAAGLPGAPPFGAAADTAGTAAPVAEGMGRPAAVLPAGPGAAAGAPAASWRDDTPERGACATQETVPRATQAARRTAASAKAAAAAAAAGTAALQALDQCTVLAASWSDADSGRSAARHAPAPRAGRPTRWVGRQVESPLPAQACLRGQDSKV